MSWSLPINLKVKLSAAWTKYLEMLANSSSFSSAAASVLPGRVPNRNADQSDNVVESWELVLSILGEEEAVEEDGELKLLPVFLSLPQVLQLRFIFILRSNIARISSSSVQTFLGKIDSCQRNMWMKEAICQLRNAIARFNAETNQLTEKTVTKYAFTSGSHNTLQNILSKLRNGRRECWQGCPASSKLDMGTEVVIGNIVASKNTEDIPVKPSSSVSPLNSVSKNTTFSHPHLSENIVSPLNSVSKNTTFSHPHLSENIVSPLNSVSKNTTFSHPHLSENIVSPLNSVSKNTTFSHPHLSENIVSPLNSVSKNTTFSHPHLSENIVSPLNSVSKNTTFSHTHLSENIVSPLNSVSKNTTFSHPHLSENIVSPLNSVTKNTTFSHPHLSENIVSPLNSVSKNTTFSHPHLSENIDIIIIDDDSTDCEPALNDHSTKTIDNTANECCSNSNTFATCSKDISSSSNMERASYRNSKQPAGSESIAISNKDISNEQTTVVSDNLYLEASEQASVDSSIHAFEVQNLKADRKRKLTEIVTETDLIKGPVAVEKTLANKMEVAGDLVVEVKGATSAKILIQPDIAADSLVELSGNVMLYLDSIREACSSNENALVKAKDIMNCFLEMETAEIKMACAYLGLCHFSENALVNFCDSMPWASLENESSVVLLDSCFSSKLTNLESQVSRTMLMSLDSISRIQPKALINVLVHILQVSQSGVLQCQVLTSVCKDFLPPEYFCYILRQLSKEDPVMNEHLVNVLQTLLDKGPDLDADSLSHFHSLLTSGHQDVSSSAKFGKLLMAVLKKYLKKMSNQQFITICALVESHNSSFRKPLQALVKHCT